MPRLSMLPRAREAHMADETWKERRILVVDDQLMIRTIVKRLVSNLGFVKISDAEDGNDAMLQMLSAKPDLVVCDIFMEPMNGLDLLKQVRTGKAAVPRNLPFALLTSHGEDSLVA